MLEFEYVLLCRVACTGGSISVDEFADGIALGANGAFMVLIIGS